MPIGPYIPPYPGGWHNSEEPNLTTPIDKNALNHVDTWLTTTVTEVDRISGSLVASPDRYGALANGSNDCAAIQAAIDAQYAAGGGVVQCGPGKVYSWSGIITVKTGVTLAGQVIRQNTALGATANVPGLVALDGTAQLKVGDWSNANALAPGGVKDLYVDGNNVGAASTAKKGLVRIAGGNMSIRNLYTVRSAGDGTVYDGTQNSTVHGGLSVGNVGVALALDNGPGALTFHGGYYGTSQGGNLEFRDTAGETSIYPFGPAQCSFFGTIFEDDNAMTTPHAHNAHLKCGFNNTFYGCNFSGNIVNSVGCSVLVDNTDTAGGLPNLVRFDSCEYYTATGQDAVRVVGPQWAFFTGIQQVGDDNTHHAPSFACLDSGFPKVSIDGEVTLQGTTPVFRTINSGSVAGCFNNKRTGTNWIFNAIQYLSVQEEADAGHRLTIDLDGAMRWFTNSTTVVDGSLANDTTAGNGMIMGGIWSLGNGWKRRTDGATINSVGQAVTFDCGKAGASSHLLGFAATGNSATLTITGGVADAQMRIGMLGTGVNTITWPANVAFVGKPVQPVDGVYTWVDFHYSGTGWKETMRSAGASAPNDVWAGATTVYANRYYQLPTGGWGYCATTRTTGASFDATERAFWTFEPGGHYETVTASGAGNWICPTGVTAAKIRATGAGGGGGGGGSATAGTGTLQTGGSGAGAGNQLDQEISALVATTSYAYTVGAKGTGGNGGALNNHAGVDGTDGGDTTFTGPGAVVYTAKGGGKGRLSAANSTAAVGGGIFGWPAGIAGAATLYPGCGGASGVGCLTNGNQEGGSGGVAATSTLGGNGGSARTAPGAFIGNPTGNTATVAGGVGATATQPGCGGAGGGGGAGSGSGGAGGKGGDGADGQLEWWF